MARYESLSPIDSPAITWKIDGFLPGYSVVPGLPDALHLRQCDFCNGQGNAAIAIRDEASRHKPQVDWTRSQDWTDFRIWVELAEPGIHIQLQSAPPDERSLDSRPAFSVLEADGAMTVHCPPCSHNIFWSMLLRIVSAAARLQPTRRSFTSCSAKEPFAPRGAVTAKKSALSTSFK